MTRNYYLKNIVGIYKVTNNLSGLCYVGQSVRICTRWQEHTSSKKSLLGAAIHSDGIENFTFEVLEECKKEDLNEREKFWIGHSNCLYPQGYNKTNGTPGGHVRSAETRQKISAAAKTRAPASVETRQKMSEAAKNISIETRQKMSEAAKNISAEHRQKLSEAAKTRAPASEETRQKMSEAAKNMSAEHRQKMSEAAKRRCEMKRLRGIAAGADTDHREKGQKTLEPTPPPITTADEALTSEGTAAGKEQASSST